MYHLLSPLPAEGALAEHQMQVSALQVTKGSQDHPHPN